jgi:imidazoleglycerol-phosphate dehydratase
MVPHFFRSLAHEGRFTLHVDILQGDNAHHRVESAFKAFGLAFSNAVQPAGRHTASTKGTMG